MPKIKITGLPKYVGGGTPPNCDPGYTVDPDDNTKCILIADAQAKLQARADQSAAAQGVIPGNNVFTQNNTSYPYDPNNPFGLRDYRTSQGLLSDDEKKLNQTYSTIFNTTSGRYDQPCPKGMKKNAYGVCVPNKTLFETLGKAIKSGLMFGSALAQDKENRRVQRELDQKVVQEGFNMPKNQPGRAFTMGNVETASGVQFPSMMTPPNEGMFSNKGYGSTIAQEGGAINFTMPNKKIKIKILETPDGLDQMKYGGQSSYGLDLGWKIGYTDMAKTKADHYGDSMSENDDPQKVLEAEGGETIYKPGGTVGDSELYTIKGKRHSQGGVKLSKDQVESGSDLSSFIFSDTASLKIKDPKVLEFFGFKYKKGGYTPADISKKFELNKYKAILEDPVKQSDALAIRTAELMSSKNEKMLKFLAAVQENMKGKEVPEFAMDSVAQFGGKLLPTFDDGGKTGDPILGEWSDDYETLKNRLLDPKNAGLRKAMFEEFLKDYPNSPLKTDKDGQQKFLDNFLEAQRQFMAIRAKYANDPTQLSGEDWDTGGKNARYFKEAKALGLTPLSENDIRRFQAGYRALARASRDPQFFESFGKYFKLSPVGVKDEEYLGLPISKDDEWVGNTTLGQLAQLRPEKEPVKVVIDITTTTTSKAPDVKPKFICLSDGTITQTASGIGYDTEAEAAKYCKKPPVQAPYDFLQPDKFNMLTKAMHYPELILPMTGQMDAIPGQLALEDWRAKAAQRFSTQYAAPAAQLISYTGPQGLTANLSALAGQTAQQMAAEDTAPVHSRNVDRVNQFSEREMARQDAINQFNLAQRLAVDEKRAIARQNLVKEKRDYLKENVDAYAQAWLNRMYQGDINDTTRNFYKDPRTGRNIFYNTNTLGIAGLPSGGGDDATSIGTNFNSLYKMFYDGMTNLPDDKRAEAAYELAMEAMGRETRTKKDKSTGESVTRKGISFGS